MPNVCFLAATVRLMAMIFFSGIAAVTVWGQGFPSTAYGPARRFGYSSMDLIEKEQSISSLPDSWEHVPTGPATVSADVLRHPLSSRARRRLQKALHLADLGKHTAAIEALRETLVKEPSSAPYTQNFLGVEYVANSQFDEARSSFEEAVRLMPHESVNHSNLGYSLAVTGDLNSAEREARTALQLDPANSRAKKLLELLRHARRAKKR